MNKYRINTSSRHEIVDRQKKRKKKINKYGCYNHIYLLKNLQNFNEYFKISMEMHENFHWLIIIYGVIPSPPPKKEKKSRSPINQ